MEGMVCKQPEPQESGYKKEGALGIVFPLYECVHVTFPLTYSWPHGPDIVYAFSHTNVVLRNTEKCILFIFKYIIMYILHFRVA